MKPFQGNIFRWGVNLAMTADSTSMKGIDGAMRVTDKPSVLRSISSFFLPGRLMDVSAGINPEVTEERVINSKETDYLKNLKLGRALLSVLRNAGETKRFAMQYNLAARTSDTVFLYIVLEAIGLPLNKARDIGFEKLMLSWFQYVRIGDTILDKYGKLFSTGELEEMLGSGDTFPIIPDKSLAEKGVSDEELRILDAKTLFKNDHRNRAKIVEGFSRQADHLIANMPLTLIQKKRIKEILVGDSKNAFASYVLERKYGLYPTVEETLEIIEAKCFVAPAVSLREVFSEHSSPEETAQYEKLLLYFSMYAQMLDDYNDLEEDYGAQPNFVLSIAKQYYPDEFIKLEDFLKGGKIFGGINGGVTLIRIAPRTNRRWLAFVNQYFGKMVMQKPVFSVFAASYRAFRLFDNRRRLPSSIEQNNGHGNVDSAMIVNGFKPFVAIKEAYDLKKDIFKKGWWDGI